jgi:preprotein translocase subunit SecG
MKGPVYYIYGDEKMAEVLSVVLLVFFVIVAFLLILLVLIQNEEGDSLGGIFAGGSASAFGSRSGNVLTRATTVLGALFLVISLSLALLNRTPGGTQVEAAAQELSGELEETNWLEEELNLGDAETAVPEAGEDAGLDESAAAAE